MEKKLGQTTARQIEKNAITLIHLQLTNDYQILHFHQQLRAKYKKIFANKVIRM